jgi:hypothetical protein
VVSRKVAMFDVDGLFHSYSIYPPTSVGKSR